MNEITMVKYTAEQIDQILMLLSSVASDSKVYECSLPMMSVVLDINNLLRNNAVIYIESISENATPKDLEINDGAGIDELVLDDNEDDK